MALRTGHGIHAQRIEGIAFRSDQEPAPATLLGAEKAGGLERRAADPATIDILLGVIDLPGLQLLVFLDDALAQLLVVLDLAWPVAAGELAIAIDDPLVGLLQISAATYAETSQ